MDDFFEKKNCDRCGGSLEKGRTMSMFNTDCICINCKKAEKSIPEYAEAVKAEQNAVKNGDHNFIGIGLPEEK